MQQDKDLEERFKYRIDKPQKSVEEVRRWMEDMEKGEKDGGDIYFVVVLKETGKVHSMIS